MIDVTARDVLDGEKDTRIDDEVDFMNRSGLCLLTAQHRYVEVI